MANPPERKFEPLPTPFLNKVTHGDQSMKTLKDARPPEYWERHLEPKWHDPNLSPASDLSVYGGMFQELAWIRRILIHGENQRAQIVRNDVEHKRIMVAYEDNQIKLIRQVHRYSFARLGFGAIQTAILGAILWQVWS